MVTVDTDLRARVDRLFASPTTASTGTLLRCHGPTTGDQPCRITSPAFSETIAADPSFTARTGALAYANAAAYVARPDAGAGDHAECSAVHYYQII